MKLLDAILTLEHRNFGLSLEENEDFVELKHEGKTIARFSTQGATVISIRHEADQQVQWMKSGIVFTSHNK